MLKRIKPTIEEQRRIAQLSESVKNALLREYVEVTLGGSTAKGTFLKGNHDVDVFVRFKEGGDLSDMLEQILLDVSSKFNIIIDRIHGSRDYFTFTLDGIAFEIVPVKYIDNYDEHENVTDMSPLHVNWAAGHLSGKLCDDVRLAKQFCKAARVYGAESYINGLSGHVLDILIIHYGGFDEFIRSVAKWEDRTIIDTEKVHSDVMATLNDAKLQSPLVVIDPIDPNRNAAAALSYEKYTSLIESAKKFVASPSEDFFIIPPFDLEALKKDVREGEQLIVIKAIPQVGKKDTVYTKVYKVFEFFNRHLSLHDFEVTYSDWYAGEECFLYYYVSATPLDATVLRQGPPTSKTVDANRFRKAHAIVYEKDGRLFAEIKREFVDALTCLKHLIAQPFVGERVSESSIIDFEL